MAEQAIDVRAVISLLRKHRLLLAGAALVGAAAGTGLAIVHPPMYVSTSEVLLPQPQSADPSAQIDPDTQSFIASSAAVLGPAGKALHPALSYDQVAKRVKVDAPSTQTIVFKASAPTAQQAEALADGAANAEVSYIAEAGASQTDSQQIRLLKRLSESLATIQGELRSASPNDASLAALSAQIATATGQVNTITGQTNLTAPTASILQSASPAQRPGTVQRYLLPAVAGMLLALILTCGVLIVFRRKDRRLRARDAIADAVGRPVLASLTCPKPRAVASWTHFLESNQPSTADGWALRQLLRQLGEGERRVTVVSLGNDAGALTIGPLLATYAASTGVRTRLVAAQRHDSAAALWAACHPREQGEVRKNLVVSADPEDARRNDVDLTVVVAVLDRGETDLTVTVPPSPTLIAVSAGAATVDDLARTAVAADDTGGDIVGLVVADPDEHDRTTGRMLAPDRSEHRPLRLTSISAVQNADMRRRLQ